MATASSCISRTPARPSTLAISCGSMNIEVVPCGMTARQNSVTVTMPLSTCMCAVAQAGHQIAAAGIDHLGALADGVAGIRPAIGEAAGDDGDVGAGDDLARMHVHPAPVADDQIGGLAPHGDIDQ